jgi:hypothetical protein
MTQTAADADKGNFRAFRNLRKQPDDAKPLFQGRLSLPGLPDERGFALWPTVSKKTGDTVLSGRAKPDGNSQIDDIAKPEKVDPDAAIRVAQDGGKGLTIDPHGILLFKNKQKDADNPDRPDYWGYYNPGKGERLMKVAVWTRTDRSGNVMLTGNLQRDEPQKSKEAKEPGKRDIDEPPVAPKKTKSKARQDEEYEDEIDSR